jgi:ketosteroid isomerase-like protein
MEIEDVLNRYYQLASAGDWTQWCELFTADTMMDEQLAGHVEGRGTLLAMMSGFPAVWESFTNDPRHTVIDGQRAAVLSHISGRTRTGLTVEVDVCNYFELSHGLIAYFKNVHDSAPFAAMQEPA